MDAETAYTKGDLEEIQRKWMTKIKAAEKREEDWCKAAEGAEKAFLCDETSEMMGDVPEFNILHSNIETIVPAIYNSGGKPDIRPRFNNADPAAKEAADLWERAILANIDDSRMDMEVEACAQDAFLAGRGVVRVKFDADVTQQPVMDPTTGQPVMQDIVANERVLYEVVSWRDYRQGPAKRWQDVPWVAYRHTITQEAMADLEDADLAAVQADPDRPATDSKGDVTLWEIWCKDSGKVYLIEEDGKVLAMKPDPLGLPGFFPQGQPVQPITGTGRTTPVCPYAVYKTLAQELDSITTRIRHIVAGLKVRGGFIGNAESIQVLADADDNTLTPLPDMENIVAAGGLDKAIMWWPVETAQKVLQGLYVQREQVKQAIYEVTGISDIIRGQGAASETATAQEIKTQWGSLRIKKLQRMMERQVRELFVITVEIMARRFQPQTLAKMAGMQLTPEVSQFLQKPFDHYRIDVESDSTVRADMTQNRREMAEFLQGTAQYFNTMAPIIQSAPAAAGEAAEIYAAFARQFSLGKQAEDALDRMVNLAKESSKQPKPNPEGEALQAKTELEKAKLQVEIDRTKVELDLKRVELQIKQQELLLKDATATADAAARMVEIEMEDEQQRAVAFGDTQNG
jgi:hypothetical protein